MTLVLDSELFAHAESLRGNTVLITGGGNGLGRETAIAFARWGANVVIGDIDASQAEKTVLICREAGAAKGGDVMMMRCNVTSWEEQAALFAAGFERFGKINYVLINAGVAHTRDGMFTPPNKTMAPPTEPRHSIIDVNFVGVMYTARLAQHYLLKLDAAEKKAIVFTGSMAGLHGPQLVPVYAASKHGVTSLFNSLVPTLKSQGIRTGIIAPTGMPTAILATIERAGMAGTPIIPLTRASGALVLATTDPDPDTSGSIYVLADAVGTLRIPFGPSRDEVHRLICEKVERHFVILGPFKYYAIFWRDLLYALRWQLVILTLFVLVLYLLL